MIGKLDVKTKNEDLIGELEENKVLPDAWHPFNPFQSSFLGGARAHEVPASIAQETNRS